MMNRAFTKLALLIVPLLVAGAGFALSPPNLTNPPSGEVIQLTAPPNQLTLTWSRVADATGYAVLLTAPEGYQGATLIPVDQLPGSPISLDLHDLVTGTYTWTVQAFGGHTSVSSAPSFFTVQTGATGGGDLPAPALLLLPDLLILRGDSSQIRFQWTRVTGAASYRLDIGPPDDQFILVTQPPSGTKVVREINLTQGQSGAYEWKVTPIDSELRLGESSEARQFVFTPIQGEDWDLDQSGGPSGEDFFAFSSDWQRGLSASDLNADGMTNAEDGLLLVEAERYGSIPTPTPIPGFVAPGLISPVNGSVVGTSNIVFTWQTLIGAVGYEFNLLDDNPNSNITRVLEQPSNPTVSTTIAFLQPRPRRWRVRAYFGAGAVGPYSPEASIEVVDQ